MIDLVGSCYFPNFTDMDIGAHLMFTEPEKVHLSFHSLKLLQDNYFVLIWSCKRLWVRVSMGVMCSLSKLMSSYKQCFSWDTLAVINSCITKWISQRIFQNGHKIHLPKTKRKTFGWGETGGRSTFRIESIRKNWLYTLSTLHLVQYILVLNFNM